MADGTHIPAIGGIANSDTSTVTQQVVEAILTLLRSGRYRVGERLPSERELITMFDVGRSAIREATRDLVVLGLLEIQRGKGTFVRSLRADLLLRPDGARSHASSSGELLEVRLIVEPQAAALAASRRLSEDLVRLEQDVERLADAVAAGYRPPEDLGFHVDVVHATHNRSLVRVTGAIVTFYQVDTHLPTQRDVSDHAAILEAILNQDPAAASSAMQEHLERELDRS